MMFRQTDNLNKTYREKEKLNKLKEEYRKKEFKRNYLNQINLLKKNIYPYKQLNSLRFLYKSNSEKNKIIHLIDEQNKNKDILK